MQKTLPNGKWRKRLKIKALPPFAELHKVRAGNYKMFNRIAMEPDAGGSNVYGNIQTNGSMEDANVSKRFCSYCGKEIMAQAIICPHCGCAVAASPEVDIPSTGLNVLSFFIPLVGLILYCVHQNKTPRKARAIGKWALIGFGVDMFVSILLYMVIFLLL